MLRRFFEPFAEPEPTFAVPEGTRVYAVGDIHGRRDLLGALHRRIADDLSAGRPKRAVVIYLGDYVDRGEDSRGVLDLLIDEPIDGAEAVHLLGNHEEFMLRFLDDADVGLNWFLNGGDATLASYGVSIPTSTGLEDRMTMVQHALAMALPETHLAFLKALKPYHVEGDYVFVHAGIHPDKTMEDQTLRDLLWIRTPFLESRADFGFCVVHGHSIAVKPQVRANRIGLDTGAYATGTLTCAVLEGRERRWLQT